MPIPTSVSDLSTTASSNYPGGGESPSTLDDYIRAHAAIIRQVSDAKANSSHTHTATAISDSTAAGRTLLTAADASAQRTALGLGTAAVAAATDFLQAGAATSSGLTMETGKLLGRTTASTGAIEEISVGYGLTFSGGSLSATLTSGTAVASTSGTAIDFTGIPAWVKRITVMFSGVSTNGTSPIQIQLGKSAGFETTGYSGSASWGTTGTTHSSGAVVQNNSIAASVSSGVVFIDLLDATNNVWVICGNISGGSGTVSVSAGSKALAGALDRIRITTVNGTDTFDAGSINILYE